MTESRTPHILSEMTADLNADDPAALRARVAELEGQIDAALEEIGALDVTYGAEMRVLYHAMKIIRKHTGRGHP